ncbi:MAG: hypothetical protein AMXMBFR83_00090 [Phycisphaerae bacterium]
MKSMGWFEVIFLMAVGVLVVMLIGAVRRRPGVALGVLAGLAALAVLAVSLYLFVHRSADRTLIVGEGFSLDAGQESADSYVSTGREHSLPPAAGLARTSPERPAADEGADVYPSVRTAAAALGKTLLRSLYAMVPNGQTLRTVRISGDVGADDLAVVAEAVRPFVGQARIEVRPSPAEPEAAPAPDAVALRIDAPDGEEGGARGGLLSVELTATGGSRRLETRVRPAGWIEDLNQWRARHDTANECLVLSTGAAGSSVEAATRVENEAVRVLLPVMQSAIGRRFPDLARQVDLRQDWLREQLARSVGNGQFVRDRFRQQVHKDYGTTCREWVLLELSPDKLDALAGQYGRELRGWRSGILRTLLSAGGLVLGIIMMYLFLNAATKGYYAWRLRLLGVVAVVAGIVVVLRLA